MGKPVPGGLAPSHTPEPFSNAFTVDYRAGQAAPRAPHPYAQAARAPLPQPEPVDAALYARPAATLHTGARRTGDAPVRHMSAGQPAVQQSRVTRRNAAPGPLSNHDMDQLAQRLSHEYMASIGTKTTSFPTESHDVMVKLSSPAASDVAEPADAHVSTAAGNRRLRAEIDELRNHLRDTMAHVVQDRSNSTTTASELMKTTDKLHAMDATTQKALEIVASKLAENKKFTQTAIAHALRELRATTSQVENQNEDVMKLIGEMVNKMEANKQIVDNLQLQQQKTATKIASSVTGTNLTCTEGTLRFRRSAAPAQAMCLAEDDVRGPSPCPFFVCSFRS